MSDEWDVLDLSPYLAGDGTPMAARGVTELGQPTRLTMEYVREPAFPPPPGVVEPGLLELADGTRVPVTWETVAPDRAILRKR